MSWALTLLTIFIPKDNQNPWGSIFFWSVLSSLKVWTLNTNMWDEKWEKETVYSGHLLGRPSFPPRTHALCTQEIPRITGNLSKYFQKTSVFHKLLKKFKFITKFIKIKAIFPHLICSEICALTRRMQEVKIYKIYKIYMKIKSVFITYIVWLLLYAHHSY